MFGCFKTQDKEVSLRIDGIPADAEVKVALLDAEKTMQEIGFKRDGSIFVMPKESSSSLYIITFQ